MKRSVFTGPTDLKPFGISPALKGKPDENVLIPADGSENTFLPSWAPVTSPVTVFPSTTTPAAHRSMPPESFLTH
jgi:hypothetical protein